MRQPKFSETKNFQPYTQLFIIYDNNDIANIADDIVRTFLLIRV